MNVTLISISRGKPRTHVVLEFLIDGDRRTCELIEVPGETSFTFDEAFGELFGRTMFPRHLGRIARDFLRGQHITTPMPLSEYPVAHGLSE